MEKGKLYKMDLKVVLEQMAAEFEIIDNERKNHEEESIISILKYLGIPEDKSANSKCISEFLTYDRVFVVMPKAVYDTIDFCNLNIPNRLKFYPNIANDEWMVVGDNDIKPVELLMKFDTDFNYSDRRVLSETLRINHEFLLFKGFDV
jgi:hypothetical protein